MYVRMCMYSRPCSAVLAVLDWYGLEQNNVMVNSLADHSRPFRRFQRQRRPCLSREDDG